MVHDMEMIAMNEKRKWRKAGKGGLVPVVDGNNEFISTPWHLRTVNDRFIRSLGK